MTLGCAVSTDNEPLGVSRSLLSGTFEMEILHSGSCVDVEGVSQENGADIHQWACNSAANQRWIVKDVGGGYHTLQSVHSGRCLDIGGWSTSNGGNLIQWDCHGGNNQQFRFISQGSGVYQLQSRHSGKCLDVSAGSTANGATIHQWDCHSGNNQRFLFSSLNGGGGGTTNPGNSCNYTNWSAGTNYPVGSVVLFNGNYFVAEHENPGYDPTISTWFWEPTSCGGTNPTSPTTGGSGFASIVSQNLFNQIYPNRNGFYTYQGLVEAAATYPGFSATGDTTTRKREAAAFLANVAHETGHLRYVEEIARGSYCSSSAACPCAPGKSYYGRGPIQLSWNYNYCAAGAALGLDLRSDPDMVARSSKVAWQTGLWFWMTQSGAGNRPAHTSMVSGNGFGETIRTINGSLECNGANPDTVQKRVTYYKQICDLLGVSYGANLPC